MKIYFAGSIRGGRDDAELYGLIIEHLKTHGEVLTEHIGDKKLTSSGEASRTSEFIHDRDLGWLTRTFIIARGLYFPPRGNCRKRQNNSNCRSKSMRCAP